MRPAVSLLTRLEDHLNQRSDLLPRGSRVLVALSGGPDSTALLHLLTTLKDRLGIELRAAHFDHGVRPESSVEAAAVARRASELGVPCSVGSAPPPSASIDSTTSRLTQARLRDQRYAFLSAETERTSSHRLATAHHADDQAETVLFRILRGTGLRGLAGIPGRRGRIVRPLLPFGRSELRGYLRARDIEYVRDPSNADLKWARARVRHRTLPALELSWRGEAAPRLQALARTASRADAALDDVAWRVLLSARRDIRQPPKTDGAGSPASWSFAAERLVRQDEELLARGLRRLARRAGVQLRAGGTEAGVQFIKQGRSGAEIDLGGGLQMWREFATITVGVPSTPLEDRLLAVNSRTNGSGSLRLGGRGYNAVWTANATPDFGAPSVTIPDRMLRFPLDLRARRPGDRIRLTTGSRTLKRLFNDLRVPRRERARLPVLAQCDEVLWAYGVAVAEGLQAGLAGGSVDPGLTVQIAPSLGVPGPRTEICNDARG